jgi:hypothetical protein
MSIMGTSSQSFEHRSMFDSAREELRASYFEGRHIKPPTSEEFELLATQASERPTAHDDIDSFTERLGSNPQPAAHVRRFMQRVLSSVK